MKTKDLWEEQRVDLGGNGVCERATISELASSKIQNQQHVPTTTCFVFREREKRREENPLPVAKKLIPTQKDSSVPNSNFLPVAEGPKLISFLKEAGCCILNFKLCPSFFRWYGTYMPTQKQKPKNKKQVLWVAKNSQKTQLLELPKPLLLI
jgi:hypothetical protein